LAKKPPLHRYRCHSRIEQPVARAIMAAKLRSIP
jgi:hypothetical protein